MSKHNYIFLGGIPRSGTNLLHRILSGHPEVTAFKNTHVPEDEGQHLQTVYPPAKEFGGPGLFALDRKAHFTEKAKFITPSNRDQLTHQWLEHWDRQKPWRIEKSPPNVIRGRFLQAMFPGCHLLFIVRHPAAASFAAQKSGGYPIPELFRHWAVAHETMRRDLALLKNIIVVRYEDLTAHPETVLGRITESVGLPSHTFTDAIRPDVNGKYFARWEEWQREYPKEAKKLLKNYVEDAKAFGYSLSAPYAVERPDIMTIKK